MRQYCSWRITADTIKQMHLTLRYLSQQNENETDELYVHNGENTTGGDVGSVNWRSPFPKERNLHLVKSHFAVMIVVLSNVILSASIITHRVHYLERPIFKFPKIYNCMTIAMIP